jgi:hypothetical protein
MSLLATLEDFFSSRGEVPPVEEDHETVMRAMLALTQASEVVRSYCRRNFILATETVTLDGTGTSKLLLPDPPIVSVIGVTEVDLGVVDADDYRLDPDAGILALVGTATTSILVAGGTGGVWLKGFRNYEVELEHGYVPLEDEGGSDDPSNLPADIQMVTISVASRRFAAAESAVATAAGETTAISIGEYREEFAEPSSSEGSSSRSTPGLTEDEAGTLDRYRLVRIG